MKERDIIQRSSCVSFCEGSPQRRATAGKGNARLKGETGAGVRARGVRRASWWSFEVSADVTRQIKKPIIVRAESYGLSRSSSKRAAVDDVKEDAVVLKGRGAMRWSGGKAADGRDWFFSSYSLALTCCCKKTELADYPPTGGRRVG